MYPNPQDVLPLPPRPGAEQYRKRAKELVKACKSGDGAARAWAARWVARLFELQTDVPRRWLSIVFALSCPATPSADRVLSLALAPERH